MKIIEFKTEAQATQALAVINAIADGWWRSQGFTVEDGELVGRNAKTGADEPNKTRTTTWDVVKESPDSTFYFTSPAVKKEFEAWRERIPAGLVIPADKDFPDAWVPVEEDV